MENIFLEKFKQKSDSELQYIIENPKSYNNDAYKAAKQVLANRNLTDTKESNTVETLDSKKDEIKEQIKSFEKTLKKKGNFSWSPKYEKEIRTDIDSAIIISIVQKVFSKLEWDIVYSDKKSAEAKCKGDWNNWTEKIVVSYTSGKLVIKSSSLGNEIYDNGRNSKRVRLFIYAFQLLEKDFDTVKQNELKEEIDRKENWEDYIIPESLPNPTITKRPNIIIPLVGSLVTALFIGLVLANISYNGVYFIGLFEVIIGFCLGLIITELIKLGNYTKYENLHYLLIAMILIIYVSNQYFQYNLFLKENNEQFSFGQFLILRLKAGLVIKDFNTGIIGLLISWGVQLVLTYYISITRMIIGLSKYQIERVPNEVIDFTTFHFIKEKNEAQVRTELSQKGWSEKMYQDQAFEALGALQTASDLNRME